MNYDNLIQAPFSFNSRPNFGNSKLRSQTTNPTIWTLIIIHLFIYSEGKKA